MSFNDITGAFRRSRAAYKGKITMIVNDLNKKSEQKMNEWMNEWISSIYIGIHRYSYKAERAI